MQEYLSNSLEDTKKVALDLIKMICGHQMSTEKAVVVGLYGELGAGKTTFMKYFAEALGVKEEITSPTFVIMKFFNLSNFLLSNFQTLIHIDAYRLESGEDLKKLGWNELIADPRNLICIEWPERVNEILPDHIMVRFEHLDEWSRKVLISYEKK